MTTAPYLLGEMLDRFQELTPHRDFRNYVGMSGIGGCMYDLYMRAKHNIPADDRLKWYGFAGQLHEAAVKLLLGQDFEAVATFIGRPNPEHELIAGFDDRYRGHIDTRLARDNVVIEAKSVNWRRFQSVKQAPDNKHHAQVQAYMAHGNFDHGILVYICRDMPHRSLFRPACPLWAVDVYRDDALMQALDDCALEVLAALDGDIDPPHCSCGWCERNWSF